MKILETKDGSPSLELHNSEGIAELMHNSVGAFSESLYIYGEALKTALEWDLNSISILSLGLGLGYNEAITVSLCLKYNRSFSSVKLHSYETEALLADSFLDFVLNGTCKSKILEPSYKWIFSNCEKHFDLPKNSVREELKAWSENMTWEVCGEFSLTGLSKETKYNVIFYDAFSRKMNPGLWSEEGFMHFFSHHTLKPCILSTYACTGALKRSLKAEGFELLPQPGFSGKRESTRAIRPI